MLHRKPPKSDLFKHFHHIFMMSDLPEEYRKVVESLCRIYNIGHKERIMEPDSIDMETSLKGDLGLRHIHVFEIETLLQKRYPDIKNLSFTPGIRTVGDVINYINRGIVQY